MNKPSKQGQLLQNVQTTLQLENVYTLTATYPDCAWPPLVTSSWDRVIDELEAEIENLIDRAPMSDL